MCDVILIIAVYLGVFIRSKETSITVFNVFKVKEVLSILLLLCGLEFTLGCMIGVISGIYLRAIRDLIVEMIKEEM